MPRILQRPNEEQDVTLQCEAHKPEGDRIVWRTRALTRAQEIDYEAERNRIFQLPAAQQRGPLNALVRRVVAGWSNIQDERGNALPFDDGALDLFVAEELLTIAAQLPSAAGWGQVRSKKSSPSPSPAVSNEGSSAAAAVPAVAVAAVAVGAAEDPATAKPSTFPA